MKKRNYPPLEGIEILSTQALSAIAAAAENEKRKPDEDEIASCYGSCTMSQIKKGKEETVKNQ